MRVPSAAVFIGVLAAGLAAAQEPAPAYPPPAEVKAAFLERVGRPRAALDSEVLETKDEGDGLFAERVRFVAEKKADGALERIPAFVLRPAKGKARRPAVVVLHGTGGHKTGERERAFMIELARRGIVALSFDARHHGERAEGAEKDEAYQAAIVRAWRAGPDEPQEHPWLYDTCWDVWRALDYLETRDDVDASRLGLAGFSMGGIETWLAGAVDARVKVAVPMIAVQSFRWSLENDQWQGRARTIRPAHEAAAADLGEKQVDARVCRALWNKVIPGMLDVFDAPSMLRLFAPDRALLILGSDDDPNCPPGGAQLAIASAVEAYGPAAEERLGIDMAWGIGHNVSREQITMALDWLTRWLAP